MYQILIVVTDVFSYFFNGADVSSLIHLIIFSWHFLLLEIDICLHVFTAFCQCMFGSLRDLH